MRRTLFVERELIAHRGRRTVTVRIKIYKPVPDPPGAWRCPFEVFADERKLQAPPVMLGVDGLQALLLAIGWIVFTLELFENDTGMRVDDHEWLTVWNLRPRIGPVSDTKRRAAIVRKMEREMKREMAKLRRRYRAAHRDARRVGATKTTRAARTRARASHRRERAGR